MSIPTPQLGMLIMDDGREFGATACERIPRIRPTSVRLAVAGAPDRPGIRTVSEVSAERFTLRTAIKAAAAEGLFLIAAPRQVQDPLSAFVDAAHGAASTLDAAHPGYAVVFLDASVEIKRIALVADLNDPVTTGLAAWAAVGIASRYGTEIDVLVLGEQGHPAPADWREGMARFSIRGDGQQMVGDALQRAVAHGLELRWKSLGSPADPCAAVLRAVTEGEYDLVVDDLPALAVGMKPGRRRRVEAALTQSTSSATAYRLVREAPCSVLVVLDAARMGLVTPDIVRAGAATLALGVVGVGALTSSSVDPTSTAAAIPPAVAPNPAVEVAAAAAAPAPDISAMGEAELDALRQQLSHAIAARDDAAEQLEQQRAAHAQAQAQAVHAQQQGRALTPAAEQARTRAQEASQEAARKTILSINPLTLLAGGPTADEAKQARQQAETRSEESRDLQEQVEAWQQSDEVAQAQLQALDEQLDATQQALATAEQQVTALDQSTDDLQRHLHPVAVPVAPGYDITTVFGQSGRYWSSGFHTGLDFAHHTGAAVFAAKSGVVVESGWAGAYGNSVVIEHPDGSRSRYAHLSSNRVVVGQSAKAGERIGAVGATGNVTGAHLHFEVMDTSGAFKDPKVWLGIPL